MGDVFDPAKGKFVSSKAPTKDSKKTNDDYTTCPECKGTGQVKDKQDGVKRECPICDGEGIVTK